MKLRVTIGEQERHEIEVEQSWMGKRKITVNGEDVIDKRGITSLSETVRFTAGEQEKQEMRVKFSRGISGLKIDVYAHGKLIAKS